MYYDEYLEHFGILGMKWGRRKAKRQVYKNKLNKISENKNHITTGNERSAISYAKGSVGKKAARSIATSVVHTIMSDFMTGRINYGSMNKAQIASKLVSVAGLAGVHAVSKNAEAKLYSKKYNEQGNRKQNVNKYLSRYDVAAVSVGVAGNMAPVIHSIAHMKLRDATLNRMSNQDKFRKWGGNILSEKAGRSTIWTDGNMAILDRS